MHIDEIAKRRVGAAKQHEQEPDQVRAVSQLRGEDPLEAVGWLTDQVRTDDERGPGFGRSTPRSQVDREEGGQRLEGELPLGRERLALDRVG